MYNDLQGQIYSFQGNSFLNVTNSKIDLFKESSIGSFLLIHSSDTIFNEEMVNEFEHKAVSYLEKFWDCGFPYAEISFLKKDSFRLVFDFRKGPLILFDSLHVISDSRCDRVFLSYYLGLEYDSPFNAKSIDDVGRELTSLGYVLDSSRVVFGMGRAKPIFYISKKEKNSAQGLLAYSNLENAGLSGNLSLKLIGLRGKGGRVKLDWRSYASSSQELKFNYSYLNAFRSGLKFLGDLQYRKQDTSFVRWDRVIGLGVPVGRHSLGFNFVKSQYASGKSSSFQRSGVSLTLENSTNVNNDLRVSYYLNTGFHIRMNDKSENNNQLTTEFETDFLCRLGKNGFFVYFRSKFSGIHVKPSDSLSVAELYPLGGTYSLRGLIENALYVRSYNLLTFEMRYVLEGDDHLFLFVDRADLSRGAAVSSYGVGLRTKAKTGRLEIVYALPKFQKEAVDFAQSKVHLGFELLF